MAGLREKENFKEEKVKKVLIGVSIMALIVIFVGLTIQDASAQKKKSCTTIQQGILKYAIDHYLAGKPLKTGYDIFGYNYQAMMFNGLYANSYFGGDGLPPFEGDDVAYLAANPNAVYHWAWPYRNDNLAMKWNDAWLSNLDCDGDGKLDRHLGYASYINSGAWLTNHQSGTYEDLGKTYAWNYFCKIVAVSSSDVLKWLPSTNPYYEGTWFKSDGKTEIGACIWGAFAVIQEVYNDQGSGDHGILYRSPVGPGFGKKW